MIDTFPRALILLFLLISSPSMSFAQQKCIDIFTVKTAPRVDALQDLRDQLKTKSEHWWMLNSKGERQWIKHLDRILKEWDDPYSLTFDIKADAARNGFKPREKIAELFSIFMAKSDNAKLATELNRWIQSEAQALIAVELMMKAGFKQYETVFDALYSSNLFISDAHPVRGPPSVGSRGLVTFSFEKEGINPKITEYYRDPKYTKNQWAQLSPDQQISALKSMGVPHKEFLPPDVVAPNPKKPSFLGGYSREANDGVRNKWGWEIAHKRFEISRHRIMNQVKQIVAFFESHSVHFHIVFELPKKYANFDAFRRWYKHVNDYLYLRGLEEGLHGTEYSSIVNDKRDLSHLQRIRSWFNINPHKTYLPQRLSDITKFGFKFFSMGLRGGDMYGPPSSKDSVKVGLELRDTTRNVDHLDMYTHQVTEAVTTYRWENISKNDLDQSAVVTPRLSNLKNTALPLLKQVVTNEMANYLFKIESGLAVPLIRYEQGQYYNFKTEKFETVSAEKAKELEIARNTYITSLKNLEIEINTMRERGEPIEDQHVQMAIRMSIAEWAALAKASELYSGF